MIAIVEDDALMRDALLGLLDEAGLPARAFASAEEFLESGEQGRTSCLVSDIRLPGMSGLELQARLRTESDAFIIFITGHGDDRARMQASQAGAVGFLTKPFDAELLLQMVRTASAL